MFRTFMQNLCQKFLSIKQRESQISGRDAILSISLTNDCVLHYGNLLTLAESDCINFRIHC